VSGAEHLKIYGNHIAHPMTSHNGTYSGLVSPRHVRHPGEKDSISQPPSPFFELFNHGQEIVAFVNFLVVALFVAIDLRIHELSYNF
jgi:hypothetical protein